MSDQTMCDDSACPRFEKCYRAQAPVNQWRQSYFMFSPRLTDGTCPEYTPTSFTGRTCPEYTPISFTKRVSAYDTWEERQRKLGGDHA